MNLIPSLSFFLKNLDPHSERERGATAVEYGLLVALIAAVIIGTITMLGPIVNDLYEAVQWW